MPIAKSPDPTRPTDAPSAPDSKVEVEQSTPAPEPEKASLPPDLRTAIEASWARHESAYRYLGR